MKLRPCIDIHNGRVKQIVGGTLRDEGDRAAENYVSEQDAGYFASLFRKDRLPGGHIILLNPRTSPYYEETRKQALLALKHFPEGMMVGGGITPDTAGEWLDAGASHVIVTSYVFADGHIVYDHLEKIVRTAGQRHLVLDLSCRKRDGRYYIVTDRWQKFTDTEVTPRLLGDLASYCDEFLVHGVDVEGKSAGADEDLIGILSSVGNFPVTYAGGISSFEDLERIRAISGNSLDVTIGSALSIYGGSLSYEDVVAYFRK
ncbi:MAG: phosphoribosylformimino-5-aminoimidazole carboxamide ribotide isomerase [Lachnospiraceae bacterium]|nr:phosphoribosylformimino-5-aminoimidazole carboxamide ribotide isomerase [Lachnospiraceae bacterium]